MSGVLFAAVATDALEHAAVSLPNVDTGVRVLVSDAADRRHGDVDNYTVNMSDVVSSNVAVHQPPTIRGRGFAFFGHPPGCPCVR